MMEFPTMLQQMQARWAENRPADLRLPRPKWLTDRDALSAVYGEEPALLREGTICYGCIVQANEILFKLFPHADCPAHILYSTDPRVTINPGILLETALDLFRYKNRPPERVPAPWQEIARVITDEYDRSAFSISIDYPGSPIAFRFLPVMVFRKHLPGRKLNGKLLPLITAPDCRSVLILPKQYWPAEFTDLWTQHRI